MGKKQITTIMIVILMLTVIFNNIITITEAKGDYGLDEELLFSHTPDESNNGVLETDWETDNKGYSYLAMSFTAETNYGLGVSGIIRFGEWKTIFERVTVIVSDSRTKNFDSSNIEGKTSFFIVDTAIPAYFYVTCNGLTPGNEYYLIFRWKYTNGISGVYRDTNKGNPDSVSYEYVGGDQTWHESDYDYNLILYQISNTPPAKPESPNGPIDGELGEEYTFTTRTTDPSDHNISYNWDFNGDYEIDLGSNFYTSGNTASSSYIWTETGTYNIRVQAIDEFGGLSPWSDKATIQITESETNHMPDKTSKPGGINEGYVGTKYKFSSWSYDNDGDQIKIGWDWNNDNQVDEWGSWIDSGATDTAYKKWDSEGTYNIKTRAKDNHGKTGPWSVTKQIKITRGTIGSTYYPEDYGTPYEYGDTHLIDLYGSLFTPKAEEDTGGVGVFTKADALPDIMQIYGSATAEACQRLDFYVGREKELQIDAELLYTGARLSTLASYAQNLKLWMIDDINNKYEEELNYPWEADYIVTKILEYLFTMKFVSYYVKTVPYFSVDLGLKIVKITKVSTTIISTATLFLIAEMIFFISQIPGYSDLNSHLMSLEENDCAEIKHIKFSHTFQPGEHSIWVGLKSKSDAVYLGQSMSFGVGQVQNIHIDGLAPPQDPSLDIPTNGYLGEEIQVKASCIDPNNDDVKYKIKWGDGETTTSNYYDSGEETTITHSYENPGEYEIEVTAIDIDKMETKYPGTFTITIVDDQIKPNLNIITPDNGIYMFGNYYPVSYFPFSVIIGDLETEVDAIDVQSGIKKVKFELDDETVKVDETSPYNWYWNTPSKGYCELQATAIDNSDNYNTDLQKVHYFNFGSTTMTVNKKVTNTDDITDKTNWELKLKSDTSTNQEVESTIDDLNNFSNSSISFRYEINYGDGSPLDIIEKQYPLLEIEHVYKNNKNYTIKIKQITTLTIDNQTFTHTKTIENSVGKKTKNKIYNFPIINKILQKIPLLKHLFQIIKSNLNIN